ncbi:hypothetical protein ACSFBF_10295 [Variovorax sp. ZT5P49]|uniref:hypothetical protein n=1 Tax=Variovorax sp. ZT5P49 TaxID=3443733 RepID=UPI003F455B6E
MADFRPAMSNCCLCRRGPGSPAPSALLEVITPQRPARVAGYKQKIDETPWIVASVRHTLDGAGYVSQLTLETEQAAGVEGQEGPLADA